MPTSSNSPEQPDIMNKHVFLDSADWKEQVVVLILDHIQCLFTYRTLTHAYEHN